MRNDEENDNMKFKVPTQVKKFKIYFEILYWGFS